MLMLTQQPELYLPVTFLPPPTPPSLSSPAHSPLNTAGTPLEPVPPAAAPWWALDSCARSHSRPSTNNSFVSAGSYSCSLALNYLEIFRRKSNIKWSHRKLQRSCAHLPFSAFDSELRWLVRMNMNILATFFFFFLSGLFKYTVMWAGLTTPAAVTMVTNSN